MRNISLSRSLWVSTVFGRELRLRGDERDLRRNRVVGIGIEHDTRFGRRIWLCPHRGSANRRPCKRRRRRASRTHGRRPARPRRYWRCGIECGRRAARPSVLSAISTVVEFDVVGRRVERVFGFRHPRLRGIQRGIGAIELLPALIEQFLGLDALLHRVNGAVHSCWASKHLASSAEPHWRWLRRPPFWPG